LGGGLSKWWSGCDDVCEHDTNADEVDGNGWEHEDGSHDGDENEVDVADGSCFMCNNEWFLLRQYLQ